MPQKKKPSTPIPLPPVDERVRLAKAFLAQEQPDVMREAIIKPAGMIDRIINYFAPSYMTTNPRSGDISYYPANLEGKQPQEIADLFTHELEHRRQVKTGTVDRGGEDYHRQPAEMAAYEAQTRRAVGQGRSTVVPSFWTGEDIYQADTNLPSTKRQAMLKALQKKP
jgi:hypothetical protein